MTVDAVYRAIDAAAPFSESMDFDNTGILIGDPQAEVTDALICLDVAPRVLREAGELGAQLIISHHPVIFTPLRAVRSGTVVHDLIRSGLNVISAHTNLDKAYPYGVNHALAEALGLQRVHGIIADGNGCIAYMGELAQEMTPEAFAGQIKEALGLKHLRYTPANRMIRTAAVVGGAGGAYAAEAALCGADAFVTGEVKQHEAIAARDAGLVLYEAGHYHTEIPFRPMLAGYLAQQCPGVCFHVSKYERPPMESL
ncbi:MAG: Nif3-like dinuclear metal center hexameric protein [Hominenteromicrobium sp.]